MLSSDCSRGTRGQSRSKAAHFLPLSIALSVPLWLGCSTSSDGETTGSGGAATGGTTATGPATGGAATGGATTTGFPTGGAATGGTTTIGPATGGAATGGSSTGGAATGGALAGGSSTGGAATGGALPGGSSTGGAATGGSSAGGAATGGSSDGGAETGGSSDGGATPGGSSAGGAATGGSGGGDTGSPGCGSDSPLQSGDFTVDIDGTQRNYKVKVPSGYDANNEYLLIFVWHPLGGNAAQVANGYNGLEALANNTAIFATADGLYGSNNEASGNGWWNANGGDMKLFAAMLENINNNLCVDQTRIFSTGFSFGGMMSYTLPFEFDVFRAIAPQSGDLWVIPHEDKFDGPVPIMAFHGDSDPIVPTTRGRDARDEYLARNNCGTQTQPVDPNPCVEYQGCDVPTIWCEFSGGHSPYGAATQAIWDFFTQF